MPGTFIQTSRSHVISRFRPDLLPSLHKVTQMRHTFRQKTLILSLLELLVEDYAHFICPEPRGSTELLKNAKNRFQIGLVFPGRWHKYQNLVCIVKTSCLFERHFIIVHLRPGISSTDRFNPWNLHRRALAMDRSLGSAGKSPEQLDRWNSNESLQLGSGYKVIVFFLWNNI